MPSEPRGARCPPSPKRPHRGPSAVGIVLGAIVLAESLLPAEIGGAVMIIGGLLLANSRYGRRPLYGRAAGRHASGKVSATSDPRPATLPE